MYPNCSNVCCFEGRLTKDPEMTMINAGTNSFQKGRFTIAVNKNLNKNQRANAQQQNKPTADFVPCEIIGKQAEILQKYYKKGSAIKVITVFESYSYQDKNTGQMKYGYKFNVVALSFTTANYNNNNNGQQSQYNNNNNNNNNNSNNYSNNNNYNNNNNNNYSNNYNSQNHQQQFNNQNQNQPQQNNNQNQQQFNNQNQGNFKPPQDDVYAINEDEIPF